MAKKDDVAIIPESRVSKAALRAIKKGELDLSTATGLVMVDRTAVATCTFQVTKAGKVYARPALPQKVLCEKSAKVEVSANGTKLVTFADFSRPAKIAKGSVVVYKFDRRAPLFELG